MQFLTQLCGKKKKKTLKASYEDATARRYWFIHELILLSSLPVLCMISETKQAVDHTTWETFPFLFQQ